MALPSPTMTGGGWQRLTEAECSLSSPASNFTVATTDSATVTVTGTDT